MLIIHHQDKEGGVPAHLLSAHVKRALDQQWERLRFGKHVDKVVPFLPLGMAQLRDLIDLKLEEMSLDHR